MSARLHQFVRAIEAVLCLPKGSSTKKFVYRGSLIVGDSTAKKAILQEIYDLRSTEEHLHDWNRVIADEEVARLRSVQAEILACDRYVEVLERADLLAHFVSDATSETFWAGQNKDVRARVRARLPNVLEIERDDLLKSKRILKYWQLSKTRVARKGRGAGEGRPDEARGGRPPSCTSSAPAGTLRPHTRPSGSAVATEAPGRRRRSRCGLDHAQGRRVALELGLQLLLAGHVGHAVVGAMGKEGADALRFMVSSLSPTAYAEGTALRRGPVPQGTATTARPVRRWAPGSGRAAAFRSRRLPFVGSMANGMTPEPPPAYR